MKVLMINSVCGIRSTGRICTDIATLLELQGHNCKIAYGRENVPAAYEKYAHKICTQLDTYVDVFKSRIFDNAGFNSVRTTKRFVKWMKEYDPDVIHLHNIHGYYINTKLLFDALKEIGKPVIWTLHDCWAFTGHCTHFDRIGCAKWQNGCHHCPQTKKYPASFALDRSQKNYADKKACFTGLRNLTIVTPSQWLANLVKQSYLGQYEVKVIPNGIDTEIFQPTEGKFREEYGVQDKKVVLGVTSAWGEEKGLYDMYKLADMLDDTYRVVLVGLKPEQMKTVPKNINAIMRTDNPQQLAHIYTTADVFVNPTYQDNYPTVNLEAQACGTPVITYATGGSVESAPKTQIVEKGDIEALCEAVKNMEQCERIDMDFSAKKWFEQYIMLYQEKWCIERNR